MNHRDRSLSVVHLFLPYVFLHIDYIIYLYNDLMVQVISGVLVCIHTGNFALDVPEASGARGSAAPTEHHGAAPAPPPPLVSIEQLLST
jgi:hypothetical protein